MNIHPLEKKDYDAWLPLWQENCLHQVSDEVSAETWRRMLSKAEYVYGLGVFDTAGVLQGFLHYVLHPVTGFKTYACYMQDLYIAEDARRQGLAKRLVWELQDIGKKEEWARIYWFAQHSNEAAQNLYKNLGIKMDFSLHMLLTKD